MRLHRTWIVIAVIGVAGLAGLGALRYLDLHPLTIGGLPTESKVAGVAPRAEMRGDVLVWIDSAAIARSAADRRYSKLDFSCAWMHLLEGGFGRVGVADGAEAPPGAAPRAVVITSSAAPTVAPERLRAWLENGVTVLVDAPSDGPPDSSWLAAAGVHDLQGGGSTRELLAAAFAALLPEGTAEELAALPFIAPPSWRVLARAASGTNPRPTEKAEPIGDPKGPLAFECSVGSGRLVISAVPLAKWWCRLTQGEPADDFSIRERFGDYADIVEPDDLALDRAQRECEVPFGDLLARGMATLLDPRAAPLPRIAWFPRGSRGAFLMTHDEDLRGGQEMLDLARRDRAMGVRGTHFVIGHPRIGDPREGWSAATLDAIESAGGVIGVHWNLLPTPRGFARIEPVQWVTPFAEQAAAVRGVAPALGPWNRNHFLIVRGTWTETFRILAAAGFEYDSTFAANKGRGYLFGSALPRPILDENGFPLPIRELPFVNQEDWGGADQAFFTRLFADDARRSRGAIVSIFHPPAVLRTPTDAALIEHVAKEALATGHLALDFAEFAAFWAERCALDVTSRVVSKEELEITYRGARGGSTLLLPLRGTATPRIARIRGALEAGGATIPDATPPDATPSGEMPADAMIDEIDGVRFLRIDLPAGDGAFRLDLVP